MSLKAWSRVDGVLEVARRLEGQRLRLGRLRGARDEQRERGAHRGDEGCGTSHEDRHCPRNHLETRKVVVASASGAGGACDTVALGFRAVSTQVAPDDVVRTHAEGAANEREPLLVLDPLLAFLDAHGLGAGDVEVTPVGDGHSNVTYALRRDGADVVLRRPPRGPLPPSAHDVLREARVLSAPRRARARARRCSRCATTTRSSARRSTSWSASRATSSRARCRAALDTLEDRRRIGEELVDALVEVHAVDWRDAGLEGFGKPTGYLERQLRRFLGLWEHNRTREIPAVESVGEWLKATPAASPAPATIVHGDYRLGNTMLGPGRAGAAGRDLRLGDGDDRRPAGRRRLPVHAVGRSPRPDGRDVRAVGRDARGGLPAARGARRPLRGALGALDDRHPLVPDAGAVEVDRLHGGQLQARARPAPPTTRTSRASATASSSSPSARRRWPVAAERSAVLLDWGGVMTSDLFGSFARLLRRARASTPTSWPTSSATTATPARC